MFVISTINFFLLKILSRQEAGIHAGQVLNLSPRRGLLSLPLRPPLGNCSVVLCSCLNVITVTISCLNNERLSSYEHHYTYMHIIELFSLVSSLNEHKTNQDKQNRAVFDSARLFRFFWLCSKLCYEIRHFSIMHDFKRGKVDRRQVDKWADLCRTLWLFEQTSLEHSTKHLCSLVKWYLARLSVSVCLPNGQRFQKLFHEKDSGVKFTFLSSTQVCFLLYYIFFYFHRQREPKALLPPEM